MDNVTPITKTQQDVVEGFLGDVLENISDIQPKACLVLMVTDTDPRFLVMSNEGLSLEGALAMAEVASSQMVRQMVGDGDD